MFADPCFSSLEKALKGWDMLEKRVENLYYLLSTYHVQNTALSIVHVLIFLIFATYPLGGDYQPHFME